MELLSWGERQAAVQQDLQPELAKTDEEAARKLAEMKKYQSDD